MFILCKSKEAAQQEVQKIQQNLRRDWSCETDYHREVSPDLLSFCYRRAVEGFNDPSTQYDGTSKLQGVSLRMRGPVARGGEPWAGTNTAYMQFAWPVSRPQGKPQARFTPFLKPLRKP